MPPEKLAEVRSDAKESIWYAGIMDRVEANPMKTLAELNTGKYDGNLSQRHIVALRGEAQQRLDAMAREQEARAKRGLESSANRLTTTRTRPVSVTSGPAMRRNWRELSEAQSTRPNLTLHNRPPPRPSYSLNHRPQSASSF